MLNVTVGPGRSHESLTIFPLLAPDAPELGYSLMAEALSVGFLRITELGSASVPELLATNSSDTTILILDGEQLVGAKQNRTTNRSLLLPPKSETRIPVSCMEQGRWHVQSPHFEPTKQSSPTAVRRKARELEVECADEGMMATPQALARAQGGVWDTVREYSSKLGSRSNTDALDDLYVARDRDIEEWVRRFPADPNQVGLLAFLGDRPLGMDIIGCRRLFSRLHDRLLRGYLLDALGSNARPHQVAPEAAQSYLGQVRAVRRVPSPTVGTGSYAVLAGAVIGGELNALDTTVHLSAFPASEQRGGGQPSPEMDLPISPPSRRRRV